jgi:glycosyltransferase involved in cell wall biosynthesis
VRVVHVHRIRGIGGSERHLLTLLPALRAQGIEPILVGLDDPTWDVTPFYEQLAVESVRLRSPRDADPRLASQLGSTLRWLRPDVVHTHLVHADVYGACTAPRSAAVVSTKHNDDRFRAGPFRHVERLITRRAARVIAITAALRRFCVEQVGLPAAKIDVVHYGLDEPPAPWGQNPLLDLAEAAPLLLCVARLVPQKGVDVLARALPAIRRRHPDTVALVLGEGPERPRLQAEGLLLAGRLGDVAALYRRADVVVHPARWEGFGLAVLEAMLAAKPVVASRVSSLPELVADGETGLLVAPDDAGALAAAVCSLLDDPGRAAALGAAGQARARAEFSVARMAERTAAVYAAARSPRSAER